MMGDAETHGSLEEEFVLIGIDPRRGRPLRVFLAKEGQWGLEYAGTADVALPEAELQRLLDNAEALVSDYPHLKVRSRSARWLLPSLRVRGRRDEGAGRQRDRAVTIVSVLPDSF